MEYKEEIIRRIAYRIYEDRIRFGLPGDEKSDWYQAESEFDDTYSYHNFRRDFRYSNGN